MSRKVSLLFAALVLIPPGLMAQARLTGADLSGTVSDESGAALQGAAVKVTSVETNVTRAATTDARGRYLVAALPPGSYRIAVELSRFASARREGVVLALGQAADIDFRLKLAGTEEEITVTVEVPLVDPTHTSVSSVVGQAQIESLPINGATSSASPSSRPASTTDRTPQQGATATSGCRSPASGRARTTSWSTASTTTTSSSARCARRSARRRSGSSRS